MDLPLRTAIERAGGVAAFAKALGITHPSVLGWASVPPRRARAVAELTGIPLHELRPDLWEPPTNDGDPTPALPHPQEAA